MNSNSYAGRRVTVALAGLVALASMIVVLAVSGTGDGHAATDHQHNHGAVASADTGKQLAFHDGMRKLWEQHVTWTRLATSASPATSRTCRSPSSACWPIRPTSATRSSRSTAGPPAIS